MLIFQIYHNLNLLMIRGTMTMDQQNQNLVYIGSYTDNKEAQSVFRYDPNTQTAGGVLSAVNPSFVYCYRDFIYIVCQIKEGQLITLNTKGEMLYRTITNGESPCHISMSNDGTYLTVCNYQSGSVAMFLLQQNMPKKIRCFMTHEGKSDDPVRQSSPHPHSSVYSRCDSIMFVADLGTDVIYYYSITKQEIKAQNQKSIKMPKTGPRTLCLGSIQQKKLFVTCELDNTIRVLSFQAGKLQLLAAYRLSLTVQNYPSQVVYFNKQVYVATRGDNMMTVFQDQGTKLKQKFGFKVGDWPRHFAITDYGVIYVAAQKENKVYRYLMKEQKILQIGQLNISSPSVIAIKPNEAG